MSIDATRARAATPGCAHIAHFNNAGSALPPQVVVDTVIDHIRREAEIGGYEAAAEANARMDAVYRSIAMLVGAAADEVALVESATVAWDAAFAAIRFQPGQRILTGRAEYVSNAIVMLQLRERTGVTIEVVPDDEHGQISVDALRDTIDTDVRLVALTHVPTSGGLVNPAAAVGAIAHDAGALFLLDACQSIGQIPIDIGSMHCDLLSATGRKFLRGPRGTGFLVARNEIVDQLRPHVLDLRSATWTSPTTYEIAPGARRFETWERSHANLLGLGAAVDYALGWGIESIEQRNTELATHLRTRLANIDGVVVRDKGERKCAIVTFTVDGVASDNVVARLGSLRINTSVTSASSAQFDMPERGLTHMVRASPHYYNDVDEVERLADAVASLPRD
jgi:cysteine desulfurase / selenocysteine lyase